MALLRVCAPEVKKKFQNRAMKKRCTPEKYFVGEVRDECGPSNAAKSFHEVVAPASRRYFCDEHELKNCRRDAGATKTCAMIQIS
jgi:hypothetical protein